jgi:hypothetical protein
VAEFLAVKAVLYPIDHLVVGLDLPDAVASHNNKIYVLVFDFHDVRLGGNHLVLRFEALVLFVLAVAECPGEVETAVDSAKVDRSTGLGNSINFLRIFGLVVLAQLLGLSFDTGYRSGVPGVCTVDEVRCDQDDVGGAARVAFLLVFGSILFLSHLLLDGDNLLPAGLAEDHVVHPHEGLLKGLLVLHGLVVGIGFQLVNELPLNVG